MRLLNEHTRENTMNHSKCFTAVGAVFGLLGVILGAFGAHALEVRLAEFDSTAVWETAADYQMWHALALLWVAFSGLRSRAADAAAVCFCLGVPLFSGSLYWLAMDGPRWLGPVTPLGGLALILGWGLLIVATLRSRN
jgi:uncharacterized membrane protein YgdD (TMEM256/DUF423 family)